MFLTVSLWQEEILAGIIKPKVKKYIHAQDSKQFQTSGCVYIKSVCMRVKYCFVCVFGKSVKVTIILVSLETKDV
uniref:Uncharacterized protein n=1 Tax=Octopus bimaculoides TaxID=37653 RepID=A0A0L8FM54_OCTBM